MVASTTSADPQATFWNTRRLFAQVLHYNLLNQLHLSYMLRSPSAERKYEYSLIACVNASREVLSRFITLRSFDGIAYSCRTVDFLALMAAMTLLLAHLDGHHSETENLLAHQYHSDRAMIEKVQENMKEINRLSSDTLSAQSADLLGRLLNIEMETEDGYSRNARMVSVQDAGTGTPPLDQDDDAVVSVHIPYFGIIKIAREGISKEVSQPRAPTAATVSSPQSLTAERSSGARTETLNVEAQIRPSGLAGSSGHSSVEAITPVNTHFGHVGAVSLIPDTYAKTPGQLGTFQTLANGANDVATHHPLQLQNDLFDPLPGHSEYPGIAAGGEDWAFQGVDLAFFESLMRSTGNETGAEWTTLTEGHINRFQ
ncbi:MAG: Polyketide KR [Lasallia pustulata]|uniref:Polyketide KR n=1 Tax=Lasallia pustulata TaxID=136370 RepID=A0A5M8PBJ7_9LECA|nr:MAG: Polyketide KR [Lasallia pustulata]